jgi:hypothetical protein
MRSERVNGEFAVALQGTEIVALARRRMMLHDSLRRSVSNTSRCPVLVTRNMSAADVV